VSGTLLAHYRVYDPALSRWLSQDPLGITNEPNLYGYVDGDPVSSSDPLGLFRVPGLEKLLGLPTKPCSDAPWWEQKLYDLKVLMVELSIMPGPAAVAVPDAGVAAQSVGNIVYRALNASGDVEYVGITGNLERRAAEQLAGKGILIRAIPGLENLSRAEARAVEQVLIEKHGLAKTGGTLLNKINSIAITNPTYADALKRGVQLLSHVGYPGF